MLTIAQFSELTGIPPSALRYYERKGLLSAAGRRANGYRVYAPDQAETAKLIASLREAGASVASIREFLERDAAGRRELLARWRRDVADRLLSIQMADRYLRGIRPDEPQLHLHRWAKPSLLLWFPARAPAGPLPFRPAVVERRRELEAAGIAVLSGGFARTLDLVDGALMGEVGFRVRAGRRRIPGDARRELVPPTLFATLECSIDDERAAHRIFRFLDAFRYQPTGPHLERYLPGIPDRYQLMIGVAR